jgi:predicted nucleic acid-binding protein
MILIDSSVWIAYFNGENIWQSEVLENLLPSEPLIIGDLILTEVLQGFRLDKDFNKAKEFLSFLNFKELGGFDITIKASINYRLLRKKGTTVRKTIDIIIGTYCIENQIKLLHNDHDFDPMEKCLDLKVISPKINH